VIHRYQSIEALATHIGRLDGTDTFAYCLYGSVMRFTEGPERYLLTPNDEMAVSIPAVANELVKRIRACELWLRDADFQDDFYLGPPDPGQGDG
jgi:hypothetical protein